MSKCLHCDKEEASYCESCYQKLIAENAKLQEEKAISNKLYEELCEIVEKDFIPKQKIKDKITKLEGSCVVMDDWVCCALKDLLERGK